MNLLPKSRAFWMILIAGFIVRLAAAYVAPHPGIADSNHYYNLGRNLAEGRGFVIDYIWNYHTPPETVTHPIDYWMPLPALPPALMLTFFPDNLFAALIPSVLIGTLLAALTYAIAAAMKLDEQIRLLAMLGVVFLPEFVLNSARTDTTLLYILFIGISCISFYKGLMDHPYWLLLAGIAAGLAHLSRQDAIIIAPAFVLALVIHWRFNDKPLPFRWLWLIPLGWVLTLAPWMWRNHELYGVLLPSGASRTLFMTSFIDQFTYGRDLTFDHYLAWGMPNIVANWITMALANVKTMYTVLGIGLPITALIGLGGLIWKKEKNRWLMQILPICIVLGLFAFYSFVTPFHTQGGSFKKSYLLLIPFLSVVGAWAIWTFIQPKQIAWAVGLLLAGFGLLGSFDLVRLDFAVARNFNQSVIDLDVTLQERGDVNGDGEIIIMTQDPFILNLYGYPALMLPSDPRDMILEAAYRYDVDYILLPAARESLDDLYNQVEIDPRLEWSDANGDYQLLAVLPR